MRRFLPVLLVVELLVGVVPVTAFYLYMFPAGVFWTRRAIHAATEGTPNLFTLGVGAAFVLGGLGLASLWMATVGRLFGRAVASRVMAIGIAAGIAVSAFLLTILVLLGAFWSDYFLYGTPVLVALHQMILMTRSRRPARDAAVPPA